MPSIKEEIAALRALSVQLTIGIDGLDQRLAAAAPQLEPAPRPDPLELYAIIRRFTGPIKEQAFVDQLEAWRLGLEKTAPDEGLSVADFRRAADRLGVEPYKIRAMDEVESAGGGFVDSRADIIALDGPGGFIDGERLPKILFEAHKFSKHTRGRFDASHPGISSPHWNRSLYKGGIAEWARLHEAMELDREAALKSASWGRYQILGENFALAGFSSVEAFISAMMAGEPEHLEAFCSFIEKKGLKEELRAAGETPASCRPIAKGYNGSGYEVGNYHGKIAAAIRKWKRA